ncbi:MAG TPA: amino acid ABC transporter permease [Candidatus Gastranaerophilales bacterium]|nr:amino acid ABC transporter permease [Candidatus Gastranaerophilales bacterium]
MTHWADVINNLGFLMKGLLITLELAFIAILGSLMLGTFLGITRYLRLPFFSLISASYIEFARSIPLILFIVFIHFGFLPYFFPGTESSFFLSSCIALIIFTSAYVAEIIRGGLNSIEKGHIDAARSLGLSRIQRLKHIILPLAFQRMMPALVSQFIALIKDTSLASTIGLIELTRAGEIIYERTYHEFEILIFIAFVYFIICFSLSRLSKVLETKPYAKLQSM